MNSPTTPFPGIESPVRVSEVESELAQLDGAIKNVSGLCSTIYSRLNRILRPVGGESNGKDQKPEAMTCPLASELREKTKELQSIAQNLESLLNRIEV